MPFDEGMTGCCYPTQGADMGIRYTIRMRNRILVNTDPQRRCYYGAHFSSELRWLDWETLESNIPTEKIDRKMKFWRELNDYAISQRGEGARTQFEAIPCEIHDEETATTNKGNQ